MQQTDTCVVETKTSEENEAMKDPDKTQTVANGAPLSSVTQEVLRKHNCNTGFELLFLRNSGLVGGKRKRKAR